MTIISMEETESGTGNGFGSTQVDPDASGNGVGDE